MRVRRTRTPAPAPAPDRNTPLAARRRRIIAVKEEKVSAIRDSAADIIECPVDEDLLAEIINRAPRARRPHRDDGYLHVSDLLKRCLRKMALSAKHAIPLRANRLSSSDLLTFAQGDAIHDAVKAMAVAGDPNAVWGRWSCKCEYLFHDDPCTYGEIDSEELCPYCATPTNRYQEVPMRNEEYNIVGNPDLILYLRAYRAFHVTELKSISHDQWKELRRPKPEHVLQVLFYWWLMRELGYRLTNKLSLFYVTKGYLFGSQKPYKEFMFDAEAELHRLEPYLEDAARLLASKTSDTLPARTACSSEMSTEAKSCEVCSICFSKP